MTYDRAAIMTAAWDYARSAYTDPRKGVARCLRYAWMEARRSAEQNDERWQRAVCEQNRRFPDHDLIAKLTA